MFEKNCMYCGKEIDQNKTPIWSWHAGVFFDMVSESYWLCSAKCAADVEEAIGAEKGPDMPIEHRAWFIQKVAEHKARAEDHRRKEYWLLARLYKAIKNYTRGEFGIALAHGWCQGVECIFCDGWSTYGEIEHEENCCREDFLRWVKENGLDNKEDVPGSS